MIDPIREEMMDLLFEPTLEIIERLEKVKTKLGMEEQLLLERLKFQVGLYALRKARKAKEDGNGIFQEPNQNYSH